MKPDGSSGTYVSSATGRGYTSLGNFGDQYSDLLGRYAEHPVKLPSPTYYLP